MLIANALLAQNAGLDFFHSVPIVVWLTLAGLVALQILTWLTVRYIPNDAVGVVEKLWS